MLAVFKILTICVIPCQFKIEFIESKKFDVDSVNAKQGIQSNLSLN